MVTALRKRVKVGSILPVLADEWSSIQKVPVVCGLLLSFFQSTDTLHVFLYTVYTRTSMCTEKGALHMRTTDNKQKRSTLLTIATDTNLSINFCHFCPMYCSIPLLLLCDS
jgi:hypothetical protein